MRGHVLSWAAIVSTIAAANAVTDTGLQAAGQQPEASRQTLDKQALEKRFSETLSGAALVGTYSVIGKNEDRPPRPERYELQSVKKLEGREDFWVFTARIKYGQKDVKLPLALKVLWAGDTPVITLTDFTIPGLGTFTARVMIYGDRYAGTWQHGEAGGHMWGRIVKDATDKNAE